MLNPEKRKFNKEEESQIPYEVYKMKQNSLMIFNTQNASLVYFLVNKDNQFGK